MNQKTLRRPKTSQANIHPCLENRWMDEEQRWGHIGEWGRRSFLSLRGEVVHILETVFPQTYLLKIGNEFSEYLWSNFSHQNTCNSHSWTDTIFGGIRRC